MQQSISWSGRFRSPAAPLVSVVQYSTLRVCLTCAFPVHVDTWIQTLDLNEFIVRLNPAWASNPTSLPSCKLNQTSNLVVITRRIVPKPPRLHLPSTNTPSPVHTYIAKTCPSKHSRSKPYLSQYPHCKPVSRMHACKPPRVAALHPSVSTSQEQTHFLAPTCSAQQKIELRNVGDMQPQ